MKESWENIADVLSEAGAKRVKVGQVLIFNYEGSPINLKIMRKRYGKVWAKKIHLYTEEELKNNLTITKEKKNGIRQHRHPTAG